MACCKGFVFAEYILEKNSGYIFNLHLYEKPLYHTYYNLVNFFVPVLHVFKVGVVVKTIAAIRQSV